MGEGVAHDFGVKEKLQGDPEKATPDKAESVLGSEVGPKNEFAGAKGEAQENERGSEGVAKTDGFGEVGFI